MEFHGRLDITAGLSSRPAGFAANGILRLICFHGMLPEAAQKAKQKQKQSEALKPPAVFKMVRPAAHVSNG